MLRQAWSRPRKRVTREEYRNMMNHLSFSRSSPLSVLSVVLVIGFISLKNVDGIERATYRFTTCGSRDKEGPTMMECTQHYCNGSGSLVCGHLLNGGTRGSQIFVVPRSGNYTVTIAGARGGHGVCSNYSGLGVIARNTVKFRRGERLRILVGQQGVSVCDGHQDVDICQLSDDRVACASMWFINYIRTDVFTFDGGGGGGGASLIDYVDDIMTDHPIVIAPGGGGAAASYNVMGFFAVTLISYNDSDNLEAFYQNFSYGHPYETYSMNVDDSSVGSIGSTERENSAGPGAGYIESRFHSQVSYPDALVMDGFGGKDCSVTLLEPELLFPDTYGGFGGGGGGCETGGGGGGYTGGSVIEEGDVIPGEGGYSWPDPPWPLVGYNDGDGYVELFLESCGCTYYCNMLNESSFECSCPPDTTLAPNGLDCYREESYFLEPEDDLITFSHPSYGDIVTDVMFLNDIVHIYSGSVIFSDESSHSCAVLFLGNGGELATITDFINRSSTLQTLELFTVTTVINNGNISVDLSTDETVLQEPFPLAVAITYGIGGGCVIEELKFNVSIDEIVSYASDASVNLSSADTLYKYLSALSEESTENAMTSNQLSLTAGAIAGIAISASLLIIVVITVMLLLTIKLCRRKKHTGSFDVNKDKNKRRQRTTSVRFMKVHNKHLIRTNEEVNPWYEWITSTYEVVVDDDKGGSYAHLSPPVKHTTDSLRYGLTSPLQNYYHYNCSRKEDDWRYDRIKLTYMREIGEGQFGKVLLMSAKDICGVAGPALVAVKTLTSRNSKDIELFSKELDLMKRFIHPNIVSLLGHCEATSDGAPLMILELMQYGDLRWFLRANRPGEVDRSLITENIAISIISDVASGLEYLTANKYVHRDVAARNCLIGADFKAKLSDFGLARGVHETDYYRASAQTLLPIKWMAPESLLYGKFTSMSDVWSFGVLVWEVATYGEVPHQHFCLNDIIEMAENETLKLNSPSGCSEILAGLIDKCTKIKPEDRPKFTEILQYCGKDDSSSLDSSSVSEHD